MIMMGHHTALLMSSAQYMYHDKILSKFGQLTTASYGELCTVILTNQKQGIILNE